VPVALRATITLKLYRGMADVKPFFDQYVDSFDNVRSGGNRRLVYGYVTGLLHLSE